jgi:NADPH:quinone reductase-like Zn-dependent oxidoreductase
MKAFVLKGVGGVENLEMVEDIAKPEFRGDELLVKNVATSLNPVEIKTRQGNAQYENIKGYNPIILGWDMSGIVEKVGADVGAFKPGDEVFGMVNFPGHGKAYAEYVAAPAAHFALKPAKISHEGSASACLAALTAWQSLNGRVDEGDKVLIHGASGGVGHYAVQIAKAIGAQVYATASGNNRDFVMSLGADVFIDYKTQRFEDFAKGMDFVLDSVGGENFARSLDILKPGGTIINLPSGKSGEAAKLAAERGVKNFVQMLVKSDGEGMKTIASLLAEGKLKSRIGRTFVFDEIPDAHSAMESGKIPGKIAVSIQ